MQGVTAHRGEIEPHVFLGRSMACFAGNTQFARAGAHDLGLDILLRLAAGGVAVDAPGVPNLVGEALPRVEQEYVVAGHPALIGKEVGEGKAELHIPEVAGHPISLHVMRAGQ